MAEINLSDLLIAAREAPPATRIRYRDPIAAFGPDAVSAVGAWLTDPVCGAFAVRVLAKVADLGWPTEAIAALRQGLARELAPPVRGDIERELARLGERAVRPTPDRVRGPLLRPRGFSRSSWSGASIGEAVTFMITASVATGRRASAIPPVATMCSSSRTPLVSTTTAIETAGTATIAIATSANGMARAT